MPIIRDPRYTGGIVGPNLPLPDVEAEDDPGALDVLAAASRQSTLPGSAYLRLTTRDPDLGEPAGYEPLDDLAGYEPFASRFIEATTPGEVAGLKSRIDEELRDRETLARAGLGGPVAEVGLAFLDPSFLAAIAVPEILLAKGARTARVIQGAIEGGAVGTVYEAGQQSLQETRTAGESALSIGGGALFGGVLGGLLRRVPRETADPVREAIRSEVGAAAVARPTTLEAETVAAGGDLALRMAGKVPFAETDLQRLLRSPSISARTTLQELAEVVPVLRKNEQGIATPASVESRAIRGEGAAADFIVEMGEQWKAYKRRPLAEGEAHLTRKEFEAAIASASRRGDADVVPEVAKAASYLRERVFNPPKMAAQRIGLLPPDGEISIQAESYFMRMYDRDAIRANRAEWDDMLSEYLYRKTKDWPEARAVAADVTRRILGTDRGLANFNLRLQQVDPAGPLHARVLDIPDVVLEKFLVNNPAKIAAAYVRELVPQIEVHRRFGDLEMTQQIQNIKDDFDILRNQVMHKPDGNARVNALQAQEREAIETILRVRDRILGRAGTLTPETSEGHRIAAEVLRGWRNLVASAKLGTAAVTGGTMDAARIVAEFGFMPTMTRLTQLATSKEFRRIARSNARRLGVATEVALARRVQMEGYGAVTDGWTEKLAEATYKYSGLQHATDWWRMLAGTLAEDRILQAASAVVNKHALDKGLRTQLASLGIDGDMLRRIGEQARQHGENVDGIRVSRSMHWTDSDAAEIYDAAIVKSARTTVLVPGAADRPWYVDGEVGKTLAQIRAFVLAAPTRLMVTPVQLVGQGRYAHAARFMGSMLIGGYLAHTFRQLASGFEPTTDPAAAAGEAFAESGLGGVLPEIVTPFARRFGVLGESARYSDRNIVSAFGGPAVGTFADGYDVLMNRTANGLSESDLHAIRRLLPLNNVWYLRRAINALEGETAEALDLHGAEPRTFGERARQTKPLPKSEERGGTGTGVIAQ
jgi:hypothetical protein